MRIGRRIVVDAVLTVVTAAAAIAVGLWVTPMQQVSAAGQTVRVGVTAPSWSLSGPGELDLFGQRIPTTITFDGPVRPRLALTRITLSRQLAELARPGDTDAARDLEHALVRGWQRYFCWQIAVVAVASMAMTGASAGWRRCGRRETIALLAVGLAVTEAVNLGAIMVTAYTAPRKLGHIRSLQALVGGVPITAHPPPVNPPPGNPPQPAATVAVVGDSTAAGLGNPPLPHPDAADSACHRSIDTYAVDLATVNNWTVANLACSGATIAAGLLGPQHAGNLTLPAQLDSPAVAAASTVIVSVGANDVDWSALLRLCAAAPTCQDDAQQAYFQQQLATFSRDYLLLLTELALLPRHPQVIINLYYNPFASDTQCLASAGITAAKRRSLVAKLDALNTVLAAGVKTASITAAAADFTGHGPCSDQPYVQGLQAPAPFHPTAAGELAIALADEQALRANGPR